MTPVDRRGMWVAVGAYVLWGVMPLYWHLLKAVPSLQIVLHRVVWSALMVGAFLFWRDGRHWFRAVLAGHPRLWWMLLLSGVLMAVVGLGLGERLHGIPTAHAMAAFWYLVVMGSLVGFSAYIWLLHHVRPALATSYAYVNPAIAVVLGALLAHERFGMRESVAMGVILLGVVTITFARTAKPRRAAGEAA